MVVHLVAVGRVRDAALRAACADYAARIRGTWRLAVHEVRSPGGDFPAAERVRREGGRLLDGIPSGGVTVGLTRAGYAESSLGLAARLQRWETEGKDVTFVIGGADGLDRSVLDRCDLALSLSALTLPHELARLLLLEQLYRATTIIQGTPYHKGR
jgi:23S rRNA (pseudouridine1915-N3)-methyltransferase